MSPHASRTNELLTEVERLLDHSQRLVTQAEGKIKQARHMLATKRVPLSK
jgi:hypothetical protein